MATQAQIDANRRNAQRSTGPTTDEGKVVASQNALRHGLRAEDVLFPGEDAAEFERFAAELHDAYAPAGARQVLIVERIIHLQWKLRRVPRMEKVTVLKIMNPPGGVPIADPSAAVVRGLQNNPTCRNPVGSLQSYELRMSREVRALARELSQLQEEAAKPAESEPAERTQSDCNIPPLLDLPGRKAPVSRKLLTAVMKAIVETRLGVPVAGEDVPPPVPEQQAAG